MSVKHSKDSSTVQADDQPLMYTFIVKVSMKKNVFPYCHILSVNISSFKLPTGLYLMQGHLM